MKLVSSLMSLLFVISCACETAKAQNKGTEKGELVLVRSHPTPVITNTSEPSIKNIYGYEGGRVVKIDGVYHLFTSEMFDDPVWVNMKLGHWQSKDRINWKRVGTIKKSSGDYTGTDTRAALWSPIPIFDKKADRWNMFYVAYRSKPNTKEQFFKNHDGRIVRSISEKKGMSGIGGPYKDLGVIMKPDSETQEWEGPQGVDSFFPWEVNGKWYAFYGSAKTTFPVSDWLAGLASSPTIGGPWKRLPTGNPTKLEKTFIENAIVTKLKTGGWLVVYDSQGADNIGWAYSKDGITWGEGKRLIIQDKPGVWSKDVRTPLGLVDEGNNRFTLFYTGFEQDPEWDKFLKNEVVKTCAIGFVELKFEIKTK
jgi:hypothetical protein